MHHLICGKTTADTCQMQSAATFPGWPQFTAPAWFPKRSLWATQKLFFKLNGTLLFDSLKKSTITFWMLQYVCMYLYISKLSFRADTYQCGPNIGLLVKTSRAWVVNNSNTTIWNEKTTFSHINIQRKLRLSEMKSDSPEAQCRLEGGLPILACLGHTLISRMSLTNHTLYIGWVHPVAHVTMN
jgi:hypothetical protein